MQQLIPIRVICCSLPFVTYPGAQLPSVSAKTLITGQATVCFYQIRALVHAYQAT